MTNGILLYAYNNNVDNYVELAKICANQIRKFMPKIGITLITDKHITNKLFDNIIIQEKPQYSLRGVRTTNNDIDKIHWFNKDRSTAYNLSPYKKTIVMDVDYLIFNNSLNNLFESNHEILCYKDIHDACGLNSFRDDKTLHWSSINNLWATVIYFSKNNIAKQVFELMSFIQANYSYYCKLYNLKNGPFRNDYAISIAYDILNLFYDNICYNKMIALPPHIAINRIHNGKVIFNYNNGEKTITSYVKNTNIHIMNKQAIINAYNATNT